MHKSPDQRLTEVCNFISEPYVWPGGYPLVLYFENGEACCAECAADHYDQIVDDTYDGGEWAVAGVSPHFEGPPEFCAACGTAIESAYGDPDSEG